MKGERAEPFTMGLPTPITEVHAPKKPEKEPVKLFTQTEATDARTKLVSLYMQGSGILDDILEIIVKDHEEVRIWELDEEEAGILADMQLEQARKDPQAARVVRKMLAVYNRLYLFMLVGPRMKATQAHIQQHGGLSFK